MSSFRRRLLSVFTALVIASVPSVRVRADPWPSITIPAGNQASLRSAPPRPPAGDAETRARHLVDALQGGAVESADDFFLPREPFLAIKDMSGAARYFGQLVRAYHRDIETYRSQIPAGATVRFVRFEPARACRWMEIGREANRLPYWACYGARLVVDAGGREVTFRIHVMINWGDQWFVTHLGPIPRRT